MPFRLGSRAISRSCLAVAMTLGVSLTASAQPPPDQSPFAQPPPRPTPPNPQPTAPSSVAPIAEPSAASQEARIRQLEAMVNQLSAQVQSLSAAGVGTSAPDTGTRAETVAPSQMGGAGAPGQSLPPNPAPVARFEQPATLDNRPGNVKFGPGFEIRSDDDEFIFQFHNLTQFEYRGFEQGGQSTVRDGFLFPRQWFIFSGRITKPFGYFVSLANGFDAVSILDVFTDVDYDPRLRFRIGRFKTPFTYEFLVEPVQGLTVPERSVFFNNFGQNRDDGVMAFGRLFDSHIDYAAMIGNGSRNGVIPLQDSKKVSAFLNWRPLGQAEGSLLENFNIGGSVYAGESQQVPIPQTLRTVVPTTGNAVVGVPFLGFNNNVRESGFEAMWDLHVAWFYKQWQFIGEWGSGVQDYALTSSLWNRVRVPVEAFYLQTSYMLTGETRSGTGIVKPLSPFNPHQGQFGTGAIEPYFRYEHMIVGNQVFTQGLADQNLWSNSLFQTWLGFNWHATQYVKVYFGWNHAEFGQPVTFAPNRRQSTSDLFLLRFQLYF